MIEGKRDNKTEEISVLLVFSRKCLEHEINRRSSICVMRNYNNIKKSFCT